MAFGLTATVIRPTIDHAGGSPQPAPISFVDVHKLPTVHDEPPPKRRRVEEPKPRKRRAMKDCLRAQVLPHVSRAVSHLDRNIYRVDDIAVQVRKLVECYRCAWLTMYNVQTVAELAKTSGFRVRYEETNGFLTARDEEQIALEARNIVDMLRALPVSLMRTSDISTKAQQ